MRMIERESEINIIESDCVINVMRECVIIEFSLYVW